ncbi:MAG: AMP-binding protein, partial [Acidobacteriota bacterium]
LHLTDREKILSLLPLFHAYLQIVNLWVASTYGCEVGYLKELSPAALSDAMKLFRPTILTTVPRLWYLFHKKIFDGVAKLPAHMRLIFKALLATNGAARDSAGTNFGRRFFGKVHDGFGGELRIAISAGSRFDEDVARDFHKLGFTILQGYGLTETSGAATATFENDNKVGSVGKPLKGAEVSIAEPNAEGVGEVLIRGPMVFDGYYRNPNATAEAFTDDGWFRSGDLGRFDHDGNLFIVGRAKDVIVLPSGKNVHPEDLEVHYLKSPLIEEIAILGVADDSSEHLGAEKLAAVVVPDFEYLRSAKVANSKEAIRYALDNLGRDLPEYQRVRDYIIRAEPLPRTGSRKIKRFELKAELESGGSGSEPADTKTWQLTAEDASVLESDAAGSVVAIISQNLNESQTIHPDMNLEIDLGLDSLGRAETFAALEHTFGTIFDADDAARALTVRDVISLVSTTNGDGPSKISSNFLNWSEIIRDSRPDFPEVKPILADQPLFTAFAFLVYKCFNLFCRVFMRLEVRNVERLIAMKRPFLICPNHQSFLDPFVVCSNYNYDLFRNTFHVGASMFFQNRFMRFVARKLQVVPVDPDTQLMKAMRAGAVGLKHGRVLNIYPEGERAYDGKLHDFKKGASILSTELDLPIIPVAIDGLQNVWARKSWRIRPAKVKVEFGEPIYPRAAIASDSAPENLSADDKYQLLTSRLRSDISRMIADLRQS